MNERLRGYLGLANRAGKALVGEAITKMWIRKKIFLLLMADDSHSNTQAKLAQAAEIDHILVIRLANKAELGQALGFDEVSSVAIIDKGLARAIIAVIKEEEK
ncbi:MAG: 50S ribosomal protein L7ae [Bacteroidia bacterium]|nr:50S ribosomal protein L7ae [Bacteroidia bacterium]